MRRLVPLVVLLAACSTAGHDTTTTPPHVEPSTTSTTLSILTTTAAESTTTKAEECVERDGVLRTSRGFVCPPYLAAVGTDGGSYLPGDYETRLFSPRLRFTRADRFETVGENAQQVGLDNPPAIDGIPPITRRIDAFAGDAAVAVADLPNLQPGNRPDDWDWTTDVRTSEVLIGGIAAHLTTFTAVCIHEPGFADPVCHLEMPAPGPWTHNHRAGIAIVVVETPEPLTILAEAGRDFDTYWTEVAQPILDSIEFLDQ